MPSFDIVSEVKSEEIRNATENTVREIATRFDFRGVDAGAELNNDEVLLSAEADFQCQQLLDIFRSNLIKRKIDSKAIDPEKKPLHSGKSFFLRVRFTKGIDQVVAKKIIYLIKNTKLKIQTSIQGDKLRVTGKNRNDLQTVIALVRDADLGQPFQFNNFRD
ncbi:MAG: YajQ family cyclic di-GMP-binding protein [Porticoccus sp.]|jgi:uncharacterized protein YajQ (UPF0234 family)|nr:YajQ family cyclic di-GMP-binding protein [Porticoccus sp.]|tara:strand:+ start:1837 stop:2322 length:486 start_codon:yes stop_codon:yes gene_type:complete